MVRLTDTPNVYHGRKTIQQQPYVYKGWCYCISSVIRQSFFLPKQSQRSRSILQDRFRSLGFFRKGKVGIIAKFHRTELVI